MLFGDDLESKIILLLFLYYLFFVSLFVCFVVFLSSQSTSLGSLGQVRLASLNTPASLTGLYSCVKMHVQLNCS